MLTWCYNILWDYWLHLILSFQTHGHIKGTHQKHSYDDVSGASKRVRSSDLPESRSVSEGSSLNSSSVFQMRVETEAAQREIILYAEQSFFLDEKEEDLQTHNVKM